MTRRRFVTADLHFGHRLLVEGVDASGVKFRPFSTVEEMNEVLIERWNATVQPGDRVYVLGDVAINRRFIACIGQCQGKLVLVKGNHDSFKLRDYSGFFDDIRAYVELSAPSAVLSHMPVHPDSVVRYGFNIHGHLHHARVLLSDGTVDPRYCNVGVEHWDYAPVELDRVLALRPAE